MVALMEQYNGMIEEEDLLYKRIDVCGKCMDILLDHISDTDEALHISTVETILQAIDVIKKDLQTELLHLRIEKSVLTRELGKLNREARNKIVGTRDEREEWD